MRELGIFGTNMYGQMKTNLPFFDSLKTFVVIQLFWITKEISGKEKQ